jgi:hypothetical protein
MLPTFSGTALRSSGSITESGLRLGNPVACVREGVRVGSADVEVLSLREPPAQTLPNVIRELLKLQTNFILCSEYKRITNESAITKIREAQNHFHWSQWVSDLPSVLSMVMNRGNRENVIADIHGYRVNEAHERRGPFGCHVERLTTPECVIQLNSA